MSKASKAIRLITATSLGTFACVSLALNSHAAEQSERAGPTVEWAARLARRRAIAEVRKVFEAPGAYVEFFSGGLCEPNGQDISIFDEKGVRAPHQVLSVGPGDRFLITFKLSDAKAYYLYYGQPGATPSPQWNPECGVFLRT